MGTSLITSISILYKIEQVLVGVKKRWIIRKVLLVKNLARESYRASGLVQLNLAVSQSGAMR